jgi:hypothetical protein
VGVFPRLQKEKVFGNFAHEAKVSRKGIARALDFRDRMSRRIARANERRYSSWKREQADVRR